MTTLNTIIEEEKKCPFCNLEEMKKKALYDYGDCYVIEPLNPVVKGHLLVIPVRHIQDFSEDAIEAGRVMQVASLVAGLKGLEYNLITSKGKNATQSVFHLHLHLVPRKEDDGLLLPWTGTSAMQRAYEAGKDERDTYWKEVETVKKQIIQEISFHEPSMSAKKPKGYNEGLRSGWYACREFVRLIKLTPTPITNEDNLN